MKTNTKVRKKMHINKKNIKNYLIFPILGSFIAFFLLISCEKDSSSTATTSSVAQLTAMRFAAQDSFPGLAKATFKIDEGLDTGRVYNVDSILYGTSIKKVVPRFTYGATPGTVKLHLSNPDTTIYLKGSDTIDFTRQPIYMSITSSDGTNTKVYNIKVTVHQADPDLFIWKQLTSQIYTPDPDGSEQQAFFLGNQLCLMVNNGFSNRFYASTDGQNWTGPHNAEGLPDNCAVRTILSDTTTAYYLDGTTLYKASAPNQWSAIEQIGDFFPITMLMTFNDSVWAIVKDVNEQLRLATLGADDQLSIAEHIAPLSDDFPTNSMAVAQFDKTGGLLERATIIGGFSQTGKSLNSRWNIEYSKASGYRIKNFSIEKPKFTSLTGASVVWYGDALYLFGGVDDRMHFQAPILYSEDEGMSWSVPDSSKNVLPESYKTRQKQSVFVYNKNIYLIGGSYLTTTFADVYQGRLNSIDWAKRD